MSKRDREEEEEANHQPFTTLPVELHPLILIEHCERPTVIRVVCREWCALIDRYTGWEALARQRFAGQSFTIVEEILTALARLTDARAQRFRRHVSYLLCGRASRILAPLITPLPLLTAALARFVKEHADNPLTLANFHPRDLRLSFEEQNHCYTLLTTSVSRQPLLGNASTFFCSDWVPLISRVSTEDDNEELRAVASAPRDTPGGGALKSVTGFIHSLFPVFDDISVAETMLARKGEWETAEATDWLNVSPVDQAFLRRKRDEWLQKYAGIETVTDLLAAWKRVGQAASEAGTAMHANLEMYYTSRRYETGSREFALFQAFERDHVHGKLRAFRSEWCVYNVPLLLCGSVDILYEYVNEPPVQHSDDGKKHLVLMDWKRSKRIVEFNQYESGCVLATRHAGNCNYVHYTIQLCLYKWMLEQSYDVVIDAMFLVVLHPDQTTYIKKEVRWYASMMDAILEHRRAQIAGA